MPASPSTSAHCPLCAVPAPHFADEHGFLLRRCSSCELVFVHPAPSPDELLSRYESRTARGDSSDYYRRLRSEGPGLREHARRLLSLLGPPGHGARLLEVGSGAGFLLDEARRAGWIAVGIEPNRVLARHARETLGLDVRDGRLEDLPLEEEGFEAAVLVDLMSHLHDPAGSLARVARALHPGGRLIIQGGLRGERSEKTPGEDWETPFHLFHFGRRSFARLLAGAGLELLSERRVAKPAIPALLADPRLGWLKELARPALPVLRRVLARAPQGDTSPDWTYTVIARRALGDPQAVSPRSPITPGDARIGSPPARSSRRPA